MIELYMAGTSNSRRASVGLSEAALPYRVNPIDLHKGDQRSPEHLARNPYGKVPVIVDPDVIAGGPVTVFESGAILLYAAEKSGKLYGKDRRDRVEVQKWFMLHMNNSIPLLGLLRKHDGLRAQCERVARVIDDHLAGHRYFAAEFSIADICFYPRIAGYDEATFPIRSYKNIARWIDDVAARPGVIEGMSQP
jgi:glutathione S-transferase